MGGAEGYSVHEIFYVDIYLILNFMMNFFLLYLTAIIRQKRRMGGRIFLFSLLFAGISTGSAYILWNEKAWRAGSALLELGGMVYAVFLPRSVRNWWREMAIFLSLALFSGGGILAFLSVGNALFGELPVSAMGMLCLSVALMGIAFAMLRRQWAAQRQNQQTLVWVDVAHGGRRCEVMALVDTGNRLVSPYTGEGVWIVSEELAERMALSQDSAPIYIPFQSLGGSGLWEAYRLERAVVEGKMAYENILVAVSPHLGEMEEIQMILNIMGS
ncbi:MAG: hypothetical protein HFH62_10465 [Lachnospiraceae bacterium]|nr:hypothetical protein [Lachnospiraceae bacterium]